MGLIEKFMIFPVLVMVILTVFAYGQIQGGANGVCISNQTANCVIVQGNAVISCAATAISDCNITSFFGNKAVSIYNYCAIGLGTLGTVPPAPAYCQKNFGLNTGQIFLPIGQNVTIAQANLGTSSASSSILNLLISDIGPAGFIGFFLALVGFVVLLSTQVLGTGINTQGTRILFIGMGFMGLWLILSAMEGVGGSAVDFFSAMNSDFGYVGLQNVGTVFYVFLTLMEVIGSLGFISGAMNE